MAMLSNLDLIRRVPLFSMLNATQAQRVADGIVKHRYKRGERMIEQGTKCDKLIILLSGRARVITRDKRGREAIIAFLSPGDHLGEMSLIDAAPHSATVEAEVQSDALVLDKDAFIQCLPENNSLSFAIMLALVKRLRHADRKIESLALLDVYGRVARALLDFAETEKDGQVVRAKITKQDLAKMVGASREMVSRVMKDLGQDGYITEREDGSLLLREHLRSFS